MGYKTDAYKSVMTALKSAGIPAAFGKNDKSMKLPYAIYTELAPDSFAADNKHYYLKINLQIEFYFLTKSPDLEDTLESALETLDPNYRASEDIYIPDGECFMKYYYITI